MRLRASELTRAYREPPDLQIETISKGLTTLKGIAEDMNTEMDRQAPMIENLEDKVRCTADGAFCVGRVCVLARVSGQLQRC